jgi:predicted ABC-type transport system involved in lysophospholipase L1 biosynthesis ATPase subunit
MPAIVSMKNVVKRYTRGRQRVEVLHGVDLEAEAGEFLALMGPSGSGKTTLLNLIAGLDKPDQGEVSVAGQRIDGLTGRQLARWRARHVGFVFQFYNLLPVLSAERNVEVPLFLTKLRARSASAVSRPLWSSWDFRIGRGTNRRSFPAGSNKGSPLLARSWPTRLCWYATSRPVTSTGIVRKRFCGCCSC